MSPIRRVVYDQIVLFGDSIIENGGAEDSGFAMVAALQQRYSRRLDIVNRGLSGYNTDQGLKTIAHVIPPPTEAKVRLLVILFGANDAGYGVPKNGMSPHVPLERYKENLINILDHAAVKTQATRILLATPPPLEERLMAQRVIDLGFGGMTWSNERTNMYADAVRDIARERSLACCDLFTILVKHAGWEPGQPFPGSLDQPENEIMKRLIFDGTHLSAEAYRIFEHELSKIIVDNWADLEPERIDYVLPAWNDKEAWSRIPA